VADRSIKLADLEAAISYYKAKIKAMKKLDIAEAQRKATLKDGYDAAKLLLDVEARIGELLPDKKEAKRWSGLKSKGLPTNAPRGALLPDGYTARKAYHALRIAENPGIVEKVKAKARETGDIPTKSKVIEALIL
jgi:hypothetical protein